MKKFLDKRGSFGTRFGAIVAVGALSGSYLVLLNNLNTTLAFVSLVSDAQTLFYVFGGVLVTGLFLGMVGTMLSIYKFLDV